MRRRSTPKEPVTMWLQSLAFDLPAAVARRVYPDQPGAVVRFTAEMLNTDVMELYPWSPAHGWTANN